MGHTSRASQPQPSPDDPNTPVSVSAPPVSPAAPPLPVLPIDAPLATLPAVPLGYALPVPAGGPPTPKRRWLPWPLLILGIVSILWGGAGVLIWGYSAVNLRADYARSIPPPPVVPPPAPPAVAVIPYDGDFVRAAGLPLEARQALVKAIGERIHLSPDRAVMLDWFLADAGRDVFGSGAADPAVAPDAIFETGHQDSGPDGPGTLGTDYVLTRRGRLSLNNSQVAFTDRMGVTTSLQGSTLTLSTGARQWSATSIRAMLAQVQTTGFGPPLTGEQAAVIAGYAADLYIASDPPAGTALTGRYGFYPLEPSVVGLESCDGPIAPIRVNGALKWILPDGRQADPSLYRWGYDANYDPLPPPAPKFNPFLQGSLRAARMMIVEGFLSAGLSVLPIAAGVATLLKLRGSARLHVAWAWLTLADEAAWLALIAWYADSLAANVPALRLSPEEYAVAGAIRIAIVLAYPVAVLCVLRVRSVRAWYDSRGETNGLVSRQVRDRWREWTDRPKVRVALAAAAALAATGVVAHASAALAVTGDGAAVPHVGMLALAAAVLAFCGWHLLASLVRRARVARIAGAVAAVAALLTLSGVPPAARAEPPAAQAPAAQPPAAPPAAPAAADEQIARASALLKELAEWAPEPEGATYDQWQERSGRLKQVLRLGPEAERLAFEALPKMKEFHQELVIDALSAHLRDRDIAPEARAAARKAIPVVVRNLQRHQLEPSCDAFTVVRRMAEMDDAVSEVWAALVKPQWPSGPAAALGPVMATANRAVLGRVLRDQLADPAASAEARTKALAAMAGQTGALRETVLHLADGSDELVRESGEATGGADGAARRLSPGLSPDDADNVRILAIGQLLTHAADPDADETEAVAAALSAPRKPVRDAAADALGFAGKQGLRRLIAAYREGAPAEDLPDLGRRIGEKIEFPDKELCAGTAAAAPESRRAASAVMWLLAQHWFNRGPEVTSIDRLRSALMGLIEGDDPAAARAAAVVLIDKFREQLTPDQAHAMLSSRHPGVLAEAARRLPDVNAKGRLLAPEELAADLDSEETELRHMAIRLVFGAGYSRSKTGPELAFAALHSKHDDVARSAAFYIAGNPDFSTRVGPDTCLRIEQVGAWVDAARVIGPPPGRTAWATPPPRVAATPGTSAPPAPAGAGEISIWPVGWLTLAAAATAGGLALAALVTRPPASR